MGLINIVNINDERREHKKNRSLEKVELKRDYGYTAYETLEYGNRSHKQSSHGLFIEFMKNSIR